MYKFWNDRPIFTYKGSRYQLSKSRIAINLDLVAIDPNFSAYADITDAITKVSGDTSFEISAIANRAKQIANKYSEIYKDSANIEDVFKFICDAQENDAWSWDEMNLIEEAESYREHLSASSDYSYSDQKRFD